MKIDGLTHPKTKEFSIALGIPLPHAVGLLEFLFAFVGKQTPKGDIGRWSNGVIAAESQWDGDADEFVKALIYAGFVEESEEHRLLVHDWPDHAPNWVHAKLKKEGKEIIRSHLSEDLRGRYKPSLTKPSQGKPSQASQTAPRSNGDATPTTGPPVIQLPLNDQSEHPITETDVERWQKLYPAVDVPQQLRNMRGWLDSNPKRRKTKSGIERFVTNWLAKEQDRGGASGKSYNFGPRAVDNSAAAEEAKRRFRERQRNADQ